MASTKTFEVAGVTWVVRPLNPDEQIEVECIILRTFGPALGAGVAALVQGLAPSLVEVLRETAGEGSKFDLGRLAELDTSDPRLANAWDKLLDALADTGGELVRDAVAALAGRLDHREIMRLFDLALLGRKTTVHKNAQAAEVTSYELLGKLLEHDPRAKWELLTKALLVTYGRETPPIGLREPDDQAEEPEAAGAA